MRRLLLWFAIVSPAYAAETIVAPNPFDLVGLALIYVGVPIACVVIAFSLRRRRLWCAAWVILVVGFYGYWFVEANPATSSKRADVTIIVQDVHGRVIRGAQVAVTQYAEGHVPKDTILSSDEAGRITIVTTSDREIYAAIQLPGFRYVRVKLERAYRPTFQEGQFEYYWSLHAHTRDATRRDTGWIRATFPRDYPLSIPVVVPGTQDDDAVVESCVLAQLPKGAERIP